MLNNKKPSKIEKIINMETFHLERALDKFLTVKVILRVRARAVKQL